MLAYILAIAVGLGSFALCMGAFFFPKIHRELDFFWSGVGLFYALVLWVCAGRITGGVLLGQLSAVALLGWFGWQTLTLRQEIALPEEKTEVQGSITSALPNLLGKIIAPFSKKSPPEVQTATVVTEEDTKSSTEVEVIVESEGDREVAETDTVESTADEEKETAKQEVEATPTVENKETTAQQEVEATPTVENKETTAQQEVEATATEQQEAIEVEIAAAEVETPEEETPETTPVDSKSESTEVSSESGEKKG